jgi:hypothetical protein
MVLRFSMATSPDMIRDAVYSGDKSSPLNTALSKAAKRQIVILTRFLDANRHPLRSKTL